MNKEPNSWSLRKSVHSAVFQAMYAEEFTSVDATELADRLCAEIEANYRTHKLDTWEKLIDEVLKDSKLLTFEERASINEFFMSHFNKDSKCPHALTIDGVLQRCELAESSSIAHESEMAKIGNELCKAKERIKELETPKVDTQNKTWDELPETNKENQKLVDDAIQKLIEKNYIACEELTSRQIVEVIKQALACGDIQRYVMKNDANAQKVVYIPFMEAERLKSSVKDLQAALAEKENKIEELNIVIAKTRSGHLPNMKTMKEIEGMLLRIETQTDHIREVGELRLRLEAAHKAVEAARDIVSKIDRCDANFAKALEAYDSFKEELARSRPKNAANHLENLT